MKLKELNEIEKRFNIKKEFKRFNDELFDGKLPTIKMRTTKKKLHDTVGHVKVFVEYENGRDKEPTGHRFIEMVVGTMYNNASTQGLLIHEMVHMWEAEAGLYEGHNDITYHGKHFLDKIKELQKKTSILIPTDEHNTSWFEKAEDRQLKGNIKEYGVIINHYKPFETFLIYVVNKDVLAKQTEWIERKLQDKVNQDPEGNSEYFIGTSSHPDLAKFKKNRTVNKITFDVTTKEVFKDMKVLIPIKLNKE